MSRTKYLESLKRELEATLRAINELTQENYELREILKSLENDTNRTTVGQR